MKFRCPRTPCLLAVLIVLGAGRPASAARALTATVEVDGRIVLQTFYTDDGLQPPERVWRLLGREPGHATTAAIPADAADPSRAALRGDLVVRIRHVDRTIVEAKASELTLVRAEPSGDRWFLPGEEVERVAHANGIPRPSPLALSERETMLAVLWGGGATLVVVLALTTLWRVRRRRQAGRTSAQERVG